MDRRPSPFRSSSFLSPRDEGSFEFGGRPVSPRNSAPLDPSEIAHLVSDVDDALHSLCAGLVQISHILDKLRQRGASAVMRSNSTLGAPACASRGHQPRLMTVVCTTNEKFWSERRSQLRAKLDEATRHVETAEREAALVDVVAQAIASIGHQFEDVLDDAKDVMRPPVPLSQRPSISRRIEQHQK